MNNYIDCSFLGVGLDPSDMLFDDRSLCSKWWQLLRYQRLTCNGAELIVTVYPPTYGTELSPLCNYTVRLL